MLKIWYAGCLGISPAILAQSTLEMHVAAFVGTPSTQQHEILSRNTRDSYGENANLSQLVLN